MRSIFSVVFFVLSSCGSASEIAAALKATPVPSATGTPGTTATAAPLPVQHDLYGDYAKVRKGMAYAELISALGEPHKQEEQKFCDNGECKSYSYLSYFYKDGKIGVTIQGGVVVYSYTMED
jgi:hypothetical protein